MSDLAATARHWGIDPEYYDVFGKRYDVPAATLTRLAEAMAGAGAAPHPPVPAGQRPAARRGARRRAGGGGGRGGGAAAAGAGGRAAARLAGRRQAAVGGGGPTLFAALAPQLGHRRFHRSGSAGDARRRARRGGNRPQSAARAVHG